MSLCRVRPLTREDLADLGRMDVCEVCPLDGQTADPDSAWVQAALRRFGFFGLGVVHDGHLMGYAMVSPSSHVPKLHPLAKSARPGSAVLLRAQVLVDDPKQATARHLVSALAGRLVAAQVPRLEARVGTGEGTCVTPSRAWLEATGFTTSETPRVMVLRLNRTLPWRQLARLLGRRALRLAPTPPFAPPEPSRRLTRSS